MKAVPPKGRKLTEGGSRPLGLDHARPRRPARRRRAGDPHAGQQPDRDPAARASRIPRPPPRSSARPRSSSSSTSRRVSCRRRSTSTGTRSPTRRASTTCSRASRRSSRTTSDQWYVFDTKKKLVVGPGVVEGRRRCRPSSTASCPTGYKLFGTPPAPWSSRAASQDGRLPGRRHARPANSYYLFKYDPPDVPQMTGADLKLSGTRQDFDTTNADQPIVLARVHEQGQQERFQEITRAETQRGKLLTSTSARQTTRSTSRSCSTARSSRGPRSTDTDGTPTGGISGERPDHGHRRRSRRRRTSRSCSRPVRCRSSS